jgi:hypothetical protein
MKRWLHEAGHLIRLGAVMGIGVLLFLFVQRLMVPAGFGQFGHYRPAALQDVRSRPLTYAGQDACAMCHEPVVKLRATGRHVGVSCEACHGPQYKHTDDPTANKPKPLVVADLCRRCHEADEAKPKGFKQVKTQEHSGGVSCDGCHQPHRPKV